MRRREFLLAALLAGLVPLVAWGAEGDKPSTRRYGDAAGTCSIGLPADWEAQVLDPREDDETEVLTIRGTTPDTEGGFEVVVRSGYPSYGARGLLFLDRDWFRSARPETKIELADDPVPHLLVREPESGDRRLDIVTCRVDGGTSWRVWLACRPDEWDTLRGRLFAVAASLRAEKAPAPEPPDGYRTREKGTLVYAWPESFSKRDAAEVYGQIDKLVRDYEKVHGKIREPAAGSRMVYIHGERSDASAVAEIPKGSSHSTWFCVRTGRLFACTPDFESPDATAMLLYRAALVLHTQRYGTPEPRWMAVGEGLVLSSRIETGKSLPAVGWLYRNMMPADPLPLDRLSDATEDIEDRGYQGVAWVAFFRGGPSRYRKAYDDFVEEFAATGDWRTAMETHLLSLDQAKLRDDLRDFLNHTIKPIHNH